MPPVALGRLMPNIDHPDSTYVKWMRDQGVPIVGGHGVENILELPREVWPRLGGKGTFIKLEGFEGLTGMYVAEIPPGRALSAEKHLYEEFMYVLQGCGATEISGPSSGKENVFEWQSGSLFTVPLNTRHRLSNGSGNDSATVLGFTNAPLILDVFHSPDFVFSNDYTFADRYDGRPDYFRDESRFDKVQTGRTVWLTNFVADARNAGLLTGSQAPGLGFLQCEMGDGILVAHIAEWPSGRYQKAHYHGGGAALLILRGAGYTLIWPQEAGIRPYESGRGAQVIRISWREGSVFSPPSGWFHQHFSTSREPVRQLALRYGTDRYGVEFHDIVDREGNLVSVRQGGTLIEYEDEDPEIQRMFVAECSRNGVEVRMPHLTRQMAS